MGSGYVLFLSQTFEVFFILEINVLKIARGMLSDVQIAIDNKISIVTILYNCDVFVI